MKSEFGTWLRAITCLLVVLNGALARADLIAMWDFDYGSLEDTWGDNHGTIQGAAFFVAGRSGTDKALELTGYEHVVVANESNFDITEAITVSAWIKVRSFDGQWQAIVTKGDSAWRLQRDSVRNGLEFSCSQLHVPGDDAWGSLLGSRTVNDGQWHHAAGVYDGQQMVLYIDGTLDVSQPASGRIALNNRPVCIGANAERGGRTFKGQIDEVAVFDHALDAESVRRLYTDGLVSLVPQTYMDKLVEEVEQIATDSDPEAVIERLNERIAAYETWRQGQGDDLPHRDRHLSPDVYFVLARAKDAASRPALEVIEAYVRAVSDVSYRTRHVPEALVWLLEHVSPDALTAMIRQYARDNPVLSHDVHHVSRHFKEKGDWPTFRRFLDTLFRAIDRRGETTGSCIAAIWSGLESNESWVRKFLEYCRSKREFTPYLFRRQEMLALRHKAQGDDEGAAEVYRAIAARCGPQQDRAVYEYRACECLFHAGQHDDAMEALDAFIDQHKASNRALVSQAMQLKGQGYVDTGEIDKATAIFLKLLIEYPASRPAAEATFFMGYCLMLQGQFENASQALRLVVQDYATSRYAQKAGLCLNRIESMTR